MAAAVAICGAVSTASAQSLPSACAVAWNHGAPAAVRASIAARHPRGAFINSRVSVGTDTWAKGGSQSSTSAQGCGIQFILSNGDVLAVWSAWSGGRITKWAGPVRSSRPIPVPNNGSVRTDGTVGFHG